ncbi:hypothetical protein [Nocardia ignorata]|uniref:Uncharacterized protein n=1 Tax=Nocardia ignorata TaxID=145285 RepID=A0A4V3CMJ0_NOCIG|nr:hypothetical protein [Nocardia ignorata]TDP29744.1 hypothetical protein DFR75_1125 [Nocardia ignorata]
MRAPLPTGTRWVAALPDGGTTQAALPTGTRARLPGRFYIPPPIAASTAEGTLTAQAAPVTTAAFTATGSLTGTQAPAPAADFVGVGTFQVPTDRLLADGTATGLFEATAAPVTLAQFTAEGLLEGIQVAAPAAAFTAEGEMVIPTSAAIAPLSTEGHLEATAAPVTLAQFTATADLLGATYGSTAAQFSAAGSAAAPLVASTTAPFTSTGTLGAAAVTFQPSGMNKSAGTTIGTSYAVVPNWTAETATYPGSTLSGHGLVVIGSTANGRVEVSLVVANGSFSQVATVTLRFHLNGNATPFHTSAGTNVPANGSATVTTFVTGVTLAGGDVITVQAISTAATNARTINSGWLRITQP